MQKFSQKDKNVENENVKLSPALFLFLEHPAVYPEVVHQPLLLGRFQGEPLNAVRRSQGDSGQKMINTQFHLLQVKLFWSQSFRIQR